MSTLRLKIRSMEFGYPGARTLFRGADFEARAGFTGIIGENGAGKSTLIRLCTGELEPDAGSVERPATVWRCPQRTDDVPVGFRRWLESTDSNAYIWRGLLGVEEDWPNRWPSLSHGERKRAQIGTALWMEPELLALDEPTNHIDADARASLIDALRRYPGVGLVVSHDRELLDAICQQCVWVEPPELAMYPGTYSEAAQWRRAEHSRERSQRAQARGEQRRLKAEFVRRREEASRSHARRSKRHLDKGDSDGRARINAIRVSNKDGVAGKQYRQMRGHMERADAAIHATAARKEWARGISFEAAPRGGRFAIRTEPCTLQMGTRHLEVPALQVEAGERIGLVGPNGAGKSTLVRWLVSGDVVDSEVMYVPQELDSDAGRAVLDEVLALPPDARGIVFSAFSRLGSRPKAVMESKNPSPGEARKLLLALASLKSPRLLVLDEPTNHLDLPSIESVEAALSEFPGAILVVSHDERFLSAVTHARWEVEVSGSRSVVKIRGAAT